MHAQGAVWLWRGRGNRHTNRADWPGGGGTGSSCRGLPYCGCASVLAVGSRGPHQVSCRYTTLLNKRSGMIIVLPRRPKFVRYWTRFGQNQATFDGIAANVCRCSANVGRFRANWPILGQVWPKSGHVGRSRARLGRTRANLCRFRDDSGRFRASAVKFSGSQATSRQTRGNFGRSGPMLVDSGQS